MWMPAPNATDTHVICLCRANTAGTQQQVAALEVRLAARDQHAEAVQQHLAAAEVHTTELEQRLAAAEAELAAYHAQR